MTLFEGRQAPVQHRVRLTGMVEALDDAVKPEAGRIPAFIFASPEVYGLELERIFNRCWLFVAHESEVPEPGDFVTRSIGEDPVVVARGEDGRIRVFLNVCRHRGMQFCRADMGHSSHFRCPYHGFTYRNTGELTGVPFQRDAYGDALDKSRLGLIQARVDSYRGLVFATWDETADPLAEYLGDMRWYLDLIAKRDEMEVCGPPQRWEIAANWKLPAENFMSDAYHTVSTHASLAELGLVPSLSYARHGYHVYAGNGHGLGLGVVRPNPGPIFPAELMARFEANLDSDQFSLWSDVRNLHATVFPNFSFLVSAGKVGDRIVCHTTIRQWQPRGLDRIEVYSWLLMEKGAPAWWKEESRRLYVLTFGPSGMFEQDDAGNWASITANSRSPLARDRIVFNYEMGLESRPLKDFPGPGVVYEGKFSEANGRAFYRRWLDLLRAGGPVDSRPL